MTHATAVGLVDSRCDSVLLPCRCRFRFKIIVKFPHFDWSSTTPECSNPCSFRIIAHLPNAMHASQQYARLDGRAYQIFSKTQIL
jgi:hypothetical protein